MSAFDDTMADAGLPSLLTQIGESGVTYTPEGGAGVSLTAIVGDDMVAPVEERGGGTSQTRTRMVTISVDPSSEFGGVASPQRGATVTLSGESWRVTHVNADSASAILTVERSAREEVVRRAYRGR